MPLETLQLGCELLLSVFTKSENLRVLMRDHLFVLSRSVSGNAQDPLFGSWDLWRLNIDTLLISTLNQIVATEDPLLSSVPPRTVESLIKISLIAPYQVVSKTIQSAIMNRGQCTILLHTLASLGQLVWLRSDPTRPTLLATVLRSFICEKDYQDQQPRQQKRQQQQQQQRQDNLVDFVLQAMDQRSQNGMVLLDQTEFLQECVVPLLDGMISRDVARGCFFHAVATIAIRLYSLSSATSAVGGSKPLHAVHFQILRLALHLRSRLKVWASDQTSGGGPGQKRYGRNVGEIGGEHMEDVARICELSVMRLASIVNCTSDIDQIGRATLEDSVRSLLEASNANDWESKLVLTPVIIACRERLGAAIQLPQLPYEIGTLCGNHLKIFSYNKPDFSCPDDSNVAKALLLSLSAGRMCDEAMQDITQALSQTSLCRSHHLETMLAPVFYRILSISSRSECHRLLTQGVPSLVALCPGSSAVDLFWEENATAMSCPLGPYWKCFTQGREQAVVNFSQGVSSESGMNLEDILLSVLSMSETLLRFALEPVPPKHKDSVQQVYDLGVGSDIMVDQMASLIQSSIKALHVDWSQARLDLVLYSFLMISKMSFSVSSSSGSKGNLIQRTLMARDPRSEESRSKQMAVAKSKARDELVLMAMNVSEEIIKRADAYHHTQGEITSAIGSKSRVTLGSDREGPESSPVARGQRRGHGRADVPRSGMPGYQNDKAGIDYPSPTSPSSSALLTSDGLDEGTSSPSPSHISATTLGRPAIELSLTAGPQVAPEKAAPAANEDTFAVESDDVAGQGTSAVNDRSSLAALRAAGRDERASPMAQNDSTLEKNDASVPDSSKPLLAPHQVDCLMLGLEFLPEQEQQAVKARLQHVL
ncbi:hypothetical protein BGZ70_006624 [Mortierella alpina]|uniref:Uncharacterized protein n=1 Tax=Mortierella alpina TaxID=64518 RepID=A0A9P6J7G4_MORAP|nr:hypothetical protein BGZ70_006624 [Mortierella alpina]